MLTIKQKEAVLNAHFIPSTLLGLGGDLDEVLQSNDFQGTREEVVSEIYDQLNEFKPFSMCIAKFEVTNADYSTLDPEYLSPLLTAEMETYKLSAHEVWHFVAKYPRLAELAFNNQAFIDARFDPGLDQDLIGGPENIVEVCIYNNIVDIMDDTNRDLSSEEKQIAKLRAFVASSAFDHVMNLYGNSPHGKRELQPLIELLQKLDPYFSIEKLQENPEHAKRRLLLSPVERFSMSIGKGAQLIKQAMRSPGSPFNKLGVKEAANILAKTSDVFGLTEDEEESIASERLTTP